MRSSNLNLLILLIFVGFVATNGIGIQPGSHEAEKQPGDQEALNQVSCDTMNDNCGECMNLGHCRYISDNGPCVGLNSSNHENMSSIPSKDLCPKAGSAETQTTTTTSGTSTPSTTTSSQNTTTISLNTTTTFTTTSPLETTTTSPYTTTTTPYTKTTTASSTSSTDSTTTTQSPSTTTTTKAPLPTTTPASPDGRGNRFDGWSFFGGMLLAVGLASIAFVSTRYYRARTGQTSPNYNRF